MSWKLQKLKKKKYMQDLLKFLLGWAGRKYMPYIRGHDPNHSTAKEKKKSSIFSLEVHTSLNDLITYFQ